MSPTLSMVIAAGALLVACASTDDAEMRRTNTPSPIASNRDVIQVTTMSEAAQGASPLSKRERTTSTTMEMHSHTQPSAPPPVEHQPRPGVTGPRPK